MLLLEGPPQPIYALAFSPDGQRLVAGAKAGEPWFWNESGSREILNCNFDAGVNSAAYSPTGESLAVAGLKGLVIVHCTTLCDGQTVYVRSDAVNPSVTSVRYLGEHLLAVGSGHRAKSSPGRFELWDLREDRRREPAFTAPNGVRAVAVQPERGLLAWSEWGAATTSGPRLTIWDIRKPDPLRIGLTHPAAALAFHPDGETLAATCEWGVRLFDVQLKRERFTIKGHTGVVTSAEFSPDGRSLATGSWDGTVRFWDPINGAERGCFRCPIGKVTAMAFSPDGLRLAAGGDKGAVVVWDLD